MVEMVLLETAKETDNKVRWDANIEDGTRFSLYIPKWRVPEPWPQLIYVTVSTSSTDAQQRVSLLSQDMARTSPESCRKPIVAHLKKVKSHTQTIRYKPEGEPSSWEIGEPYIPTLITYEEADRLTIIVEWAKSK